MREVPRLRSTYVRVCACVRTRKIQTYRRDNVQQQDEVEAAADFFFSPVFRL